MFNSEIDVIPGDTVVRDQFAFADLIPAASAIPVIG
jgi:hypothetical protein